MKSSLQRFNTFPKFSKLTYADREKYEELIQDFPAISDYSFPMLMTWWNPLDACRISLLNDNLIISYWLPGDENHSGLSLVGNNKVDESICEVFDHLISRGQQARLIHVPEFVASNIQFPDMFIFDEDRQYSECVLSTSKMLSRQNISRHTNSKVQTFLSNANNPEITVVPLDLCTESNKELLLNLSREWAKKGGLNRGDKMQEECFHSLITYANELGVEATCLYVNNQIHAYLLCRFVDGASYVNAYFGRFSYESPGLFELACYEFSKYFKKEQIEFVNIDTDFNNQYLKMQKLALGPSHYFRQYTVTPRK